MTKPALLFQPVLAKLFTNNLAKDIAKEIAKDIAKETKNSLSSLGDKSAFLKSLKIVCKVSLNGNIAIYTYFDLPRLCTTMSFLPLFDRPNSIGEINFFLRREVVPQAMGKN